MRAIHQTQQVLAYPFGDSEHAKELKAMHDLLIANPTISELAAQDLVAEAVDRDKGAPGMSADQVVRAAIVKQLNGYSYTELAFHLEDSICYQRFCLIGLGGHPWKRATLARNIKMLSPQTWEKIHRVLIRHAVELGFDKAQEARVDCTVVRSNIHHPTDSSLLFDVVRVHARLLARARAFTEFPFVNRTRAAKRRNIEILHAKKSNKRRSSYRKLIKLAVETLEYVPAAVKAITGFISTCRDNDDLAVLEKALAQLEHYEELGWRVLDQSFRRVCQDEAVPASEKLVSIFEEHTDIIVKDRRDTHYGHKVCVSAGKSSLIFDCVVLDGNPADSTLVGDMIDRHTEIFEKAPRKAAFDGGFASRKNVTTAKEKGVKDICFSKRRGIEITEMVKSMWVYKKLKRFRAGIEAGISFLKRCFGWDRCTWKGLDSFKSYTWASVVTCNLLIMARHKLARDSASG